MFGMTKKKISEQVAKQRINAALKPYLYPQGLQYWTDRFDQGGVHPHGILPLAVKEWIKEI